MFPSNQFWQPQNLKIIREKIKSSIIQKSKVKSSTQKLKVAFRVTFDNWHGSFASAMMKPGLTN